MQKIELNNLINKDISTLVIDSETAESNQFANTLRGFLRDVKETSNAQIALRLHKINRFEVIFVEVSPQVSDGLKIIKMIRDHQTEEARPTIIATNSCMLSQFSEAARRAGADFCAEHPIPLASLLVRISNSVAMRAHSADTSHHKFAFRH